METFSRVNGGNYAPKGKPKPVVSKNEFQFAAIFLDHGHIYGMCNGLVEAGATLKYVFEPDPKKLSDFVKKFPAVAIATSFEQILSDPEINLCACAAIPSLRCDIGIRVMEAGKDYFSDKAPLISIFQLEKAKKAVECTKQKYMVYYSERLHVESSVLIGELIESGEIGDIVQVLNLAPHRLSINSRPQWFFKKEFYGGILCDIGSHQIEQYLYYAKETEATVDFAKVDNFTHPEYPEFEDFGDVRISGKNGTNNYFRVDWLTPNALPVWGDGKLVVLGTKGYIEARKYIDLSKENKPNQIYLATNSKIETIDANGKTGFPFFGKLILDCLNRTEKAMTQAHAFKAAELSILAQNMADNK